MAVTGLVGNYTFVIQVTDDGKRRACRLRADGAFVLAVDLPSRIHTDTGEAAEGAAHADLTVTFGSCKPLHFAPASAPLYGRVVCADIGIRDEWHPEV